ncbi:SusD/RagB family nutrient-binding outer membrane lipoprotein [Pseudoflavitalea sp. G-6-1-2]|uniref:SusD/RagB family nutrient-binding outer membrane lipoprotein n=1 Tax=Pseudoflavitalea sp. G-6-1-2 TaxID=2728841 RepID=UPI00146B9F6F|nr:SusD/RagB family nutrient-binding outer membrane lipoprotein [Pseudoflavitalea sp. G-6-1-2]NML19267.1 SusD/RagB family nutrient-binding outer membrane lipoprotein [Pseudoflavitalea sp. G-6-1-2]
MKSIHNKYIAIVLLTVVLGTSSCLKDSADLNDDKGKVYDGSPEFFLNTAQGKLADKMSTIEVNFGAFFFLQHYLTMTTYASDARFDFNKRVVPDNHWLRLYTEIIGNLTSGKAAISKLQKPASISQQAWDKQQGNKTAILDVLQVYAFQVLVDCFGDVPYTDALPTVALPKYDDDAAIYPKLLERMDKNIAQLDADYPAFDGNGDYMLKSNVAKWKLFAASLKLKIAINLADANPSLAKSAAESAYNAGVITQNTQNISYKYSTIAPAFSPMYSVINTIGSGRRDYIVEETIINMMNGLADPRREKFFTPIEGGTYRGAVLGKGGQVFADFSHVADALITPDATFQYATAAEVNFYLAEAAARGYSVGKSAEEYYKAAITASFDLAGIPEKAAAYLAQPNVAYASAAGDWKQKIGRQAYIAMFQQPFEGWNFSRRLDYPVMPSPYAVAAAEGKTPTRLTYPINEQTVNGANWRAASSTIGGDKLTTRVFWDKQ